MAKENYIGDGINMHFADAGPIIENPFFNNSDRVEYDRQWREKYANKHRPSACGGLGKALAKVRHPSSQKLGLREFNHFQALRVPAVGPVFEDELTKEVEDDSEEKLYSLKTIEDERVTFVTSEQNELIYAGCE